MQVKGVPACRRGDSLSPFGDSKFHEDVMWTEQKWASSKQLQPEFV